MVVITYCVEYAESQKSVCQTCHKIIPNKSLRVGRMERQSEKEKKKFSKHSWYHFRCFQVPDIWTKIPIHLIRGQVNLLDKDKLRLERVIKLGEGGSWSQIIDQHQKKSQQDEDDDDDQDATEDGSTKKKSKRGINDDDDNDDNDDGTGSKAKDFTSQLTGQMDRKQSRHHHNNNNKGGPLKPITKGAKVEKKHTGGGGGGGGDGKTKGLSSSSSSSSSSKGKEGLRSAKTGAGGGGALAGVGKPMSAVEKAIAASRAESKKKLELMQSKFGKH